MDDLLNRLATVQGRRDEVPNQELAREIVESEDTTAIEKLVEWLNHKTKGITQDCIKVLYEIGAEKPKLIAPHLGAFVELLSHKNNRLLWGGMTALDYITLEASAKMAAHIPQIVAGMERDSVIAKDHGVVILAKLSSLPDYGEKAFPFLMDALWKCPSKQLPMYAEKSLIAVNESRKSEFLHLLNQRMGDLEKDSQRKRVEKVIRKINLFGSF